MDNQAPNGAITLISGKFRLVASVPDNPVSQNSRSPVPAPIVPPPQSAAPQVVMPVAPIPAEFEELRTRPRDTRIGLPQQFFNRGISYPASELEGAINARCRRVSERAGKLFGVELLNKSEQAEFEKNYSSDVRNIQSDAVVILLNRATDLVIAETSFRQAADRGLVTAEERKEYLGLKTVEERSRYAQTFGKRVAEEVQADARFEKLNGLLPPEHVIAYKKLPGDIRGRIGEVLADLTSPAADGVTLISQLPPPGRPGREAIDAIDLPAIASGKKMVLPQDLPVIEKEMSSLGSAANKVSIALVFANATISRGRDFKIAEVAKFDQLTGAAPANIIEFANTIKPVTAKLQTAQDFRTGLVTKTPIEMAATDVVRMVKAVDRGIEMMREPEQRQVGWDLIVDQAVQFSAKQLNFKLSAAMAAGAAAAAERREILGLLVKSLSKRKPPGTLGQQLSELRNSGRVTDNPRLGAAEVIYQQAGD